MSNRTDLILYATPTGQLAEVCGAYFSKASVLGSTVAQTYPPHCTLTGFFRREPHQVPAVVREIQATSAQLGPLPDDAVEIVALRHERSWVGLELWSPWLRAFTAEFAARHKLGAGDDALRPKDWLHLSLAYGQDLELERYNDLAASLFTPVPRGGWAIGLWERRDTSWIHHPH